MSEEKGQVEDILQELGKKIDHLIEEAKGASEKVSEETEKKIDDLKEQKEKLEEEFKTYRSESGERWQDAKVHLNDAAGAMGMALKSLFGSKEQDQLTKIPICSGVIYPLHNPLRFQSYQDQSHLSVSALLVVSAATGSIESTHLHILGWSQQPTSH